MRYRLPRTFLECLVTPFKKSTTTAIASFTLEIAEGECVGFVGPNGAGKTSILKMMGGLLFPSVGTITIAGYDTVIHNDTVRRKVGYVINEDRSFYWRLTGYQNLEFFGALDNLYGQELHQRIDKVLRGVGLEEMKDRQVAGFSSGMRQRLAMARGILAEPDVLILDEPTRALDPSGADDIRQLIVDERLKSPRRTLLIATHHLEEIEKICDSVCILNHGRLVAYERVANIRRGGESLHDFYRKAIVRHEGVRHDRSEDVCISQT